MFLGFPYFLQWAFIAFIIRKHNVNFVKFLFVFHNHQSAFRIEEVSLFYRWHKKHREAKWQAVSQSHLKSTAGSGARYPQTQPKTPSASPHGLPRWCFFLWLIHAFTFSLETCMVPHTQVHTLHPCCLRCAHTDISASLRAKHLGGPQG